MATSPNVATVQANAVSLHVRLDISTNAGIWIISQIQFRANAVNDNVAQNDHGIALKRSTITLLLVKRWQP